MFGENSAAVLGLLLARPRSCSRRRPTTAGGTRVGSLAIGLVLVGVATFLAREVKSLLVGEAADPSS